ncbi:ubiquitin-conjugating enzyme E2-binding protein [Morchella snyderi]|nr:ubiquitin-conjugating enzyme E2-binding protein [Morchella snyderi]
MSPSPVPIPLFHAELLPNIRSVTISITLPTPATITTRLALATPTELLLVHNGTSTPLPLPAAVAVRVATSTLRTTAIGEKTLSYRLPVAAAPASPPPSNEPAENYVPWTAAALAQAGKSISLMCKACTCVLVDGASVKTWKDLPSGNWAEMMEFWHCHKPGPDKKKQANARYGMLQGGFGAEAGTVLVDLTYFLVAQADCSSQHPHGLYCTNCKAHLGAGATDTDTHSSSSSYSLNKWKLKLRLSAHGISEEYAYPLEPFLAAKLLALAEGEGLRRMLVSSPPTPTTTTTSAQGGAAGGKGRLRLWLFSADVRYTSSAVERPMRAVKVFYQEDEEGGEGGGGQQQQQQQQQQGTAMGSGGFEEVVLQTEMVAGLRERLEEGAAAGLGLEAGAAATVGGFGGWKMGYLMRFERENTVVRGVAG